MHLLEKGPVSKLRFALLFAVFIGLVIGLMASPHSREWKDRPELSPQERIAAREGMLQQAPTATPIPSINNCTECEWYRLRVHVTAEERERAYPKAFVQQLDWHQVDDNVVPIRFAVRYCQGLTQQGACLWVAAQIDEDGVLSPVSGPSFPDPVCSQLCAGGVPCQLIELYDSSIVTPKSFCVDYEDEEAATAPCVRDTDHHIAIAKSLDGSGWNFAGLQFTQDPEADNPNLFTQAEHLSSNCETDDEFVMTARSPHTVSISVFQQNDGCSSWFDAAPCFANWFIE